MVLQLGSWQDLEYRDVYFLLGQTFHRISSSRAEFLNLFVVADHFQNFNNLTDTFKLTVKKENETFWKEKLLFTIKE